MASNTYTVERSTTIDAPPDRVFEQLVSFHNWVNWSPWEGLDPDLQRTYSGPGSGVGSVYVWSGNRKAGQGRMEITQASAPAKVMIELFFEKPFKARNNSTFNVLPAGSGCRVTWTMTGRKTLMTKVMGVFTSMDKLVGPDFERGLAQLKSTAEAPPAG
jgi:uncharacterized protein YndB with AHSA1/START domain